MMHARPRGLTVVAVLMVLFGIAEMTTGLTHDFLGITTAPGGPATAAALVLGGAYAAAGLLLLPMRRAAAGLAVILLAAIIAGRLASVALGLLPLNSPLQIVSIVAGTSVVALFALYIGWRWPEFR
jgi:hypothetical protein